MHTRLNGISAAVLSLLVGGNAGAAVLAYPAGGFQGCALISDQMLNQLRGGFSVPFQGATLNIAFAIQRVTYINGQLAAVTRLTVPSLSAVAPPTVQVIPAPPVAPSAPASPVAPALPAPAGSVSAVSVSVPSSSTVPSVGVPQATSASSAAPPATATTTVVPATEGNAEAPAVFAQPVSPASFGSGSVPASSAPVAAPGAVVTVSGPATIIQNGTAGNIVNLPALPSLTQESLLVIQNRLNNQGIRTATIVDATVNNLALYKAMNLSSRITQGIAGSLR